MPTVQLIFRKTNPIYHSIEKVFGSIISELKTKYDLEETHLPKYTESIADIRKNIGFAAKKTADIYHITGDVHYAVFKLPKNKTILTIHDCVFMRSSRGIKRIFFKWLFLQMPVRKSGFVTTISENSKKEIIQYTGCNPDKITVIPDPLNEQIYFEQRAFNTTKPKLLFIGSTPNKNLARTIQAIAGITCELNIVGEISDEHLALLDKYQIDYKKYIRLSDQEMAERYAASDIVLFASLYEGFGLPILEAQKAGRPVLTSNISPMKEVAADGACLADPEDIHSIREGLLKIIQDEVYRNEIVEAGFRNILKYEPRMIADQYLKLYEKVLKQ